MLCEDGSLSASPGYCATFIVWHRFFPLPVPGVCLLSLCSDTADLAESLLSARRNAVTTSCVLSQKLLSTNTVEWMDIKYLGQCIFPLECTWLTFSKVMFLTPQKAFESPVS